MNTTIPIGDKYNIQIIELLQQGKSYRKICKEVFYWDKNNNKRFVSLGYVHKIANKINEKKQDS